MSSQNTHEKTPVNHQQSLHIVLGAGLIGCYLGAAIVKAQQQVVLITREQTKNALAKNYSISDYLDNQYTVNPKPNVVTNIGSDKISKKADFLWLTVKCLSLASSLADIQECIDEKTVILCCQNGVGNHMIVRQAFVNNPVIRVMVPFNVVSDKQGHFHRGSQGNMIIESIPELSDTVKWLARQLNSSMLPIELSYNMTSMQWAKLQLNLGNAVNALANIPVKQMLETSLYRKLMAGLMQELLAITNKKQIKLPKIANLPNKWIPTVLLLPNWAFVRVAQKMLAVDPKVRTSMWWDLNNQRLTEIDFLNGKIVDEGKKLGIKTPFNSFVVNEIKQAEQSGLPSSTKFCQAIEELLVNQKK